MLQACYTHVTCMQHAWKMSQNPCILHDTCSCSYKCNLHLTCAKVDAHFHLNYACNMHGTCTRFGRYQATYSLLNFCPEWDTHIVEWYRSWHAYEISIVRIMKSWQTLLQNTNPIHKLTNCFFSCISNFPFSFFSAAIARGSYMNSRTMNLHVQ